MKAPAEIKNHKNFNADDYKYLTAIGWTNEQIVKRWTEEAATGNGPCQWNTLCAKRKLQAVTSSK